MEIKSDLRVSGGILATPTLSSDLSQLLPSTGELRLVDGEWLKYNGSTFESISTLGEIDNDSNQIDGAFVRWDGTAGQFITDTSIIAGQNFCSLQTIDDQGFDWCNYQVGTNGSAFMSLKKSLGTIASPTPATDNLKIGGVGFIPDDGVTPAFGSPGYVGAELSAFASGDQTETNGGTQMRLFATALDTKTRAVFMQSDRITAEPSFPQYLDTRDDGPTRDALYTDATGTLKRGRITSSFAKARSNGGSDNTVNLNTGTTRTTLSLTGTTINVGIDFTISGSGVITTNFNGYVRADYVLPHTSSGARVSLRTEVERDRGGTLDRFAATYSYIRATGGHFNDTNSASEIIQCQAGDTFKIVNARATTSTAATNITQFASFSLERIYD